MKRLILTFMLGLFCTAAVAEQYMPMVVSWERPYNRADGTELDSGEPIFYMLWATINAGQNDSERLIGAAIGTTTFIHLLDKSRTGLAGGTVSYRLKACDKYPPEGKPTEANCSESSNLQAIDIRLMFEDGELPPETEWAPVEKPWMNTITHVEKPPGWRPPTSPPPGWKPPPRNPKHPPKGPPQETGIEGLLGF